jgi:hypothetical protein
VTVSPADFELYSRVTGRPMPRSPQEQMAMTPEVYDFTRKFGRGQQVQEKPSVIQQIAGTLGNVALAGAGIAGAYGLARALGPETDISPVSTGAMSDVGEPKEKFTYTKNYKGNKSGNYGNQVPDPTSDPNFYSEVASHDFGSPTDDGFVEPYVRTTNLPKDGKNFGKQVGTVGSLQEQPTDEIVVVEDPQTVVTTPQVDPRSFLSAASNALIAKKNQEVADFDAGIDWGDTLDQAASADSPVEGALILGGGVAKKGFHDAKTRIGKDINTAGNIVSEAVANVKKIPAAMQEVDSVIANEQIKSSVMPDNKMQETTYLNPPVEGTGGVETGIESDLSDTPQFDDTHQANEQSSIAGLNRQTGLTTSSTTNLNPDLVRETARQLDGVPVSQDVKEAVAAEKLANPAQSVSYLLKSVLAGLTGGEQPTFPGKNPDEGLEDLIGAPAPATSTRMANVGGNFYPVEDSKFVEGLTTYPVSGERAGQVDFHLRNKSTGELNPYGYQVNDALNVALGDMGEEGSLNKESMGQLYNFLRKNPDLMRGV